MKVLVTGVKGQLGYDVMRRLEQCGHQAIGTDIEEMDITDEFSVNEVMDEHKPDVLIHCAAYTAVDAAEDNEELCRKINGTGTRNLAKACKRLDCKMIYISTDYVFDGQGERPWQPEDNRSPLNIYGQTKCEGEMAVQEELDKYFIVRIAWVFGKNGKNFVKTMLQLGRTKEKLTVVADQFGSPTYTYDLSELLVDMAESEQYGIYHATNEGFCSWYEFTCEIFRQAGITTPVEPVTSDAFPTKAKRPSNSRMSKDKLEENGFKRLPDWKDALGRYLKEIE